MSTLLHYRIPIALGNAIADRDALWGDTFSAVCFPWLEWQFVVRLPEQVGADYRLVRTCFELWHHSRSNEVSGRAMKLSCDLERDLGLPVWLGTDTTDDERAFLKSVARDPDDLTTWAVYADWLRDHGEYARGERIAAWLAPDPVPA